MYYEIKFIKDPVWRQNLRIVSAKSKTGEGMTDFCPHCKLRWIKIMLNLLARQGFSTLLT